MFNDRPKCRCPGSPSLTRGDSRLLRAKAWSLFPLQNWLRAPAWGRPPETFPRFRPWWSSYREGSLTEAFSEAGNSGNKPLGLARVFQCPYYLGSSTTNQEQISTGFAWPSTFSGVVITGSVMSQHFHGNRATSQTPPKQKHQPALGDEKPEPHPEPLTSQQKWDSPPSARTLPETHQQVNVGETGELLSPDWVSEILRNYC